MLIGVISDTHIPERATEIPTMVCKLFKDVELILHAGDLVSNTVFQELEKLAPTICVQGNMDRRYGLKFPKNEIINVNNVKIGLNHGEVYPRGYTQQLKYIGLELGVDVLITGHSHVPFIKEVDKMILLNPGSPTVPRMTEPSVMLVDVDENGLEAEIIKIGDSTCKALNFRGM